MFVLSKCSSPVGWPYELSIFKYFAYFSCTIFLDATALTAPAVTTATASLPFHLQFVAGAIAGVSEISTMYPLDGMRSTHARLAYDG